MSDEIRTEKEMNNQTVARDTSRLSSPLVGPIGFLLMAVYLILLSIVLVVAIIQFWPSAAVSRGPGHQLFQGRFLFWTFPLSDEGRLLLIVVLAGALGGQVRSLRSLAWYVGNKELKRSWLPQYILTPFVGAILALVSYFIIRGGFFSADSGTRQISVYGFAGLASIMGIASESVAIKLKNVSETLFTKPREGKDSKPQK